MSGNKANRNLATISIKEWWFKIPLAILWERAWVGSVQSANTAHSHEETVDQKGKGKGL